jgi:hypothetical protein
MLRWRARVARNPNRHPQYRPSWNASASSLLFANALTIALAVSQKWSLPDLMMTYWAQSVTIGFFNWMRMRALKDYGRVGMIYNGRPMPPSKATQGCMSCFFLVHYGGFHAGYLLFLLDTAAKSRPFTPYVLIGIAAFVLNHAFSYRFNKSDDQARKVDISTLFLFPYARIIPMHITIVVAGEVVPHATTGILLLFLGLKTLADLMMHLVERSMGRGS